MPLGGTHLLISPQYIDNKLLSTQLLIIFDSSDEKCIAGPYNFDSFDEKSMAGAGS